MSSRSARLFALALVSSTLACGGSPEPAASPEPASFEYRLDLEEGTSFRQLVTTRTTTTMGPAQPNEQTLRATQRFDVVDVARDGKTTIRVTTESIRSTGSGPLGPFEYDSADPPEPVPIGARALAAMVDHTLTMTYGSNGAILEITGMEELRERMFGELELPPGMSDSMRESIERLGGGAPMQEILTSMNGIFPPRAVRVGERWTNSATITSVAPMSVSMTWTLVSRREGIAHLDSHGEITPGPDSTMQLGPLAVELAFSGEQTGSAEVDEATGWTRRMHSESSFEGSMRMEGMPTGAGGTEIPLRMRAVYSVEPLLDDDE